MRKPCKGSPRVQKAETLPIFFKKSHELTSAGVTSRERPALFLNRLQVSLRDSLSQSLIGKDRVKLPD
jgi:hypothetical protein